VILGAAPEPLAELLGRSRFDEADGVAVTLRGGVEVRFGTANRAGPKWAAAAAVLADPALESVEYVDVRVPGRPAVGGSIALEAVAEPLLPEVVDAAVEVTDAADVEPEVAAEEPVPEAVDPVPADPAASPDAVAPSPAPAPAAPAETGAVAP
jgi:hypothetical protein